MVEIVWIDQAIEDIDRIAEHISKESAQYASITVAKIFYRVEILEHSQKQEELFQN